eukprot:782976-Alexandrium_andersonii.AAC.1
MNSTWRSFRSFTVPAQRLYSMRPRTTPIRRRPEEDAHDVGERPKSRVTGEGKTNPPEEGARQ